MNHSTIYSCLGEAWAKLGLEAWQLVVVSSWGLMPIVSAVWIAVVLRAAKAGADEDSPMDVLWVSRLGQSAYAAGSQRVHVSGVVIATSKPPRFARHRQEAGASRRRTPRTNRNHRRKYER